MPGSTQGKRDAPGATARIATDLGQLHNGPKRLDRNPRRRIAVEPTGSERMAAGLCGVVKHEVFALLQD
jgi:hypothetical protein